MDLDGHEHEELTKTEIKEAIVSTTSAIETFIHSLSQEQRQKLIAALAQEDKNTPGITSVFLENKTSASTTKEVISPDPVVTIPAAPLTTEAETKVLTSPPVASSATTTTVTEATHLMANITEATHPHLLEEEKKIK